VAGKKSFFFVIKKATSHHDFSLNIRHVQVKWCVISIHILSYPCVCLRR